MATNFASIFKSIAYKKIAQVDLPKRGSNQHEINGVGALREFFETGEKVSGIIHWHYFSDDHDTAQDTGEFTFYDARLKSADRTGRSEWRLYYYGDFLNAANPDDLLVLARANNGKIFGLVFQDGTSWLRAAYVLFQLDEIKNQINLFDNQTLQTQDLEFAKRQILEELGIGIAVPLLANDDEIALQELEKAKRDGRTFPSTKRMSELALSLVEIDFQNSDDTLIALLDREEGVFRAIEKIIVEEKLRDGFSSVDDFISYSLSVQNRRKSRMGYAFQNHLAKIFTENNLKFETQKYTEGKSTPDFLFPSQADYQNVDFNADSLVMLAAKSSCKERWRQILDEAERIPNKHLCTLEQSISIAQTQTMQDRNVTLVIPQLLQATYQDEQREILWSVNNFIEHVKEKQA